MVALRERGVEVHAAARRIERLEDLAARTGCIPHQLDVRDREAVARIGETVPVDILVNNAGLGRALGSLWTAPIEDIEMTIDTNVTSAIHMVRSVLPGMIERGKGHIVNMSSVLALYPAPAALYGATKGAMHKLSRDLRQELQGTGVRVTEINPGRVTTGVLQRRHRRPRGSGQNNRHPDRRGDSGRRGGIDCSRRRRPVAGQYQSTRNRSNGADLRRLPVRALRWQ